MSLERNDKIVWIETKKLIPNPKNTNVHSPEQIERLAKIINYQGFRSPIVVSNLSGFIVAGHARLEAAQKLGLTKVPVSYQDFRDLEQEWAHLNADNAIASWAELDLNMAKDFDFSLDFDLDFMGFKDFKIEKENKNTDKEDEVPEIPQNVFNVQLGDVWQLGNHRVMCGDSTDKETVEKLMNGQKADITFTSPPYNVGKTPNGNDQKYLNDSDNKSSDDYVSFLNDFTFNALEFSDYVFSNIQSLSGNKVALIEHLYALKEKFADTMIWDKMTAEPAMARKVLNSRFEYIHIFSNEAKRSIGKKDFRGSIPNIFSLNSRQGKEFAKVHKATFPVQLPEFFLNNFTETSCLDPFLGTGSTLIACEKTNRICYGMELDPHYVSVIIKRWQDFTGKTATKL